MRKLILIIALVGLPVMADDINMTPQNTFSGYYGKSAIRTTYPRLNSASDPRAELMKKRSVHEMGNINPSNNNKTPMTYSQFPKNYDSSNMLLQQGIQNGMQNMYMGL